MQMITVDSKYAVKDTPVKTIMKKRVCPWPGCTTILSKYNLNQYCFQHAKIWFDLEYKRYCEKFDKEKHEYGKKRHRENYIPKKRGRYAV